MLLNAPAAHKGFLCHLKESFGQLLNESSMHKFRTKAWDHFLELGLPTKAEERFRYLNMHKLYQKPYSLSQINDIDRKTLEPFIYPECQNSVIVFVNGCYQPHLSQLEAVYKESDKKLVVLPLREAVEIYRAFISNRWAKSLQEEIDPFATLNAALHPEAVFIYLPPKTVLETPIQILQVISNDSLPTVIMPRVQVCAGAHSQLTLINSLAVLYTGDYWINEVTDFSLEEGAHVNFSNLSMTEPPSAWHMQSVRATLKKHSQFNSISGTTGGGTIRSDYHVVLTGENAEAKLQGAWWLDEQREAHINVLMDHQAPHCQSLQLFKGVLNDLSRSSFEGKIVVRQPAQKTDAFQRNNNLILSDRAHADSKPNLEIFADDVKASHGATVGQLNQDELFYLRARGFSEEMAKNLLVYGFCQDVLELFPIPSLKNQAAVSVRQYLIKEEQR